MRIISLQFHDVVDPSHRDASGFPGTGPGSYKLAPTEFERQCAALRAIPGASPVTVNDALSARAARHSFIMTFDDGGRSASGPILDLLDRYGWKAHFFVTTDFIGKPAFLSPAHIRTLRQRGHVIGSHSCSHPERMSRQTWDELLYEWTASLRRLSDILGEEITTASVPHGYYSSKVAKTASLSGITALFTSEPVRKTQHVGNCVVLGRYVIRPGMDPARIVRLVRGHNGAWYREFLFWNAKKVAKLVAGGAYLKFRAQVLGHSTR
ncbi:MAG TPA: polysaccharide deacetylase family protein [Nitrospiraceae bacterium]|nr:polysaccharide deacetylase family protein [Nitrospiraceae bacterium]